MYKSDIFYRFEKRELASLRKLTAAEQIMPDMLLSKNDFLWFTLRHMIIMSISK